MPLDPATVITTIITTARSVGIPILIEKAKRNETVIKLLKEFKIDPTHPAPDFDTVYAYALVEYGLDKIPNDGIDKTEAILQLFREQEIKKAFCQSFYTKDDSIFTDTLKREVIWDLQDWNTLGHNLKKWNVDFREVLADFSTAFIKVLERSQTPAERRSDQKIDELREKLEQISKQLEELTAQKTDSSENLPVPTPYPMEFEALIQGKTKTFCGRKFVFAAFDKFINTNPNGYFTVVGDAGMGKSALAAKYVFDKQVSCYFNILAEGRNRPELFLKSIRQQLISRYQLQDAGDADLPTLLANVVQKRSAGERLVIVVDALDEVEQEGTGNLLYLPITLPERVYFLLTRRPYNENERRLNVSPGIPMQELDLRKHSDESSQDVKEYLWQCLNQEQDWQTLLRRWIENRQLTCGQFVEEVSKKSENNFMYLKYVLPDIARGRYDDLSLDKLPTGLEGYYENHWQQMGMTSKPLPKNKIKIVYAMSALRGAASRPVIAKYSKQNELTVQEILEDWAQFLEKQDQYDPPRYRFYHESFRDFLHRKDIVQAAGIRLPEISAEVAAAITGGIFGDG